MPSCGRRGLCLSGGTIIRTPLRGMQGCTSVGGQIVGPLREEFLRGGSEGRFGDGGGDIGPRGVIKRGKWF